LVIRTFNKSTPWLYAHVTSLLLGYICNKSTPWL